MFSLVAIDLSHSSCGPRVTPPDAIGNRSDETAKFIEIGCENVWSISSVQIYRTLKVTSTVSPPFSKKISAFWTRFGDSPDVIENTPGSLFSPKRSLFHKNHDILKCVYQWQVPVFLECFKTKMQIFS